jgi:hypothetical protein
MATQALPNPRLWDTTTPLTERENQMLDRNARLIVRLGSVQMELHKALHDQRSRWADCTNESCRVTRAVVAGTPRAADG